MDDNFRAKLFKITFNLVTGDADMKYYMEDTSPEFPIINQKFIGQKNRYAYMAFLSKLVPSDQTGKENLYFAGTLKYDMKEEKVINKIYFGPTKSSGEVFFSPRDNATEEDDGYLMTCVYDWKTSKSEFVMWDAKTMDDTPVLRAECTRRVPNSFHTFFVPESQLAK